jgi:hypothetical protein
MFDNSAIKKTGQWWKGIAASAVVISGTIIMIAGLLALNGDQLHSSFAIMLAGGALTMLGFTFACWSIRCPDCGTRWLWLAVTKQHAGSWLEWLMSKAQCPICKRTW